MLHVTHSLHANKSITTTMCPGLQYLSVCEGTVLLSGTRGVAGLEGDWIPFPRQAEQNRAEPQGSMCVCVCVRLGVYLHLSLCVCVGVHACARVCVCGNWTNCRILGLGWLKEEVNSCAVMQPDQGKANEGRMHYFILLDTVGLDTTVEAVTHGTQRGWEKRKDDNNSSQCLKSHTAYCHTAYWHANILTINPLATLRVLYVSLMICNKCQYSFSKNTFLLTITIQHY